MGGLVVKFEAVPGFPAGGVWRRRQDTPAPEGLSPPWYVIISAPDARLDMIDDLLPIVEIQETDATVDPQEPITRLEPVTTAQWRVDFERLPEAMRRDVLRVGGLIVRNNDWSEFAFALRRVSDDAPAQGAASSGPVGGPTFASLLVVHSEELRLKREELHARQRIEGIASHIDEIRVPARALGRRTARQRAQGKPSPSDEAVAGVVALIEAEATAEETRLAPDKSALELQQTTLAAELAAERIRLAR